MRVYWIFLLILPPLVLAEMQAEEQFATSPQKYVEKVLDYMQQNALNKRTIDWGTLRREILVRTKNAADTYDTYPAIAYALTQLGERHSWLQLPDNLPIQRRRTLEAQISKILARPEAGSSPFAPSKEMKSHILRSTKGTFAYVVVPMCVGRYAEWEKNSADFQDFADHLHAEVLALQAKSPQGWIIDLRGNGGGNMWPMLAGIGALIGEGDLGSFVSSDGDRTPWFYKDGKVGTRASDGKTEISAEVKQPPFAFSERPWVAVLLDRGTASSAEAVAISFVGQRSTRSFGEHTAGFSTANDMLALPDGAALFLCDGIEADRTGRLYPDGLNPDEKTSEPETHPAGLEDAALLAAEAWLSKQSNAGH